ncbi:MAG TPA: phosphate ABC transporter permease subunit PstC [Candidatus Limnocylindria bacterium]|nr:phosphate ABC transporter permease subunit PstC [Candidatus Limnocylindria bacterium]
MEGADARSRSRRRRAIERSVTALLVAATVVTALTTVGIVLVLVFETLGFFAEVSVWEFFTGTVWAPLIAPRSFGVLPLVSGTLLVAAIAILVAMPLGLVTAIYLAEYAGRRTRSIVKPFLEILAGIPTVVFGFFALTFVTPNLIQPLIPGTNVFNALSAGIVVGLMVLPMVATISEDALAAVPKALREAAHALGATKLEVSLRVVVPAALSGIIASFILAVSRAVGETMAVAIAAGSTPVLTLDPTQSVQTMTGYIAQVSLGDTPQSSLEFKTIFAVGMTLFVMTLVLNVASQIFVRRYRNVYQ